MQLRTIGLIISTCLGLAVFSGCAVPQPRGEGLYTRVTEPQTGTVYHLYLPVDYVRNKGRHPDFPRVQRWPLVMTFHGMKPYDSALPQEREWEKEADIYGYIVCAPELHSSDSFMEYPLTKEHSYVLKDREDVMAIMDHVFLTTSADPKRVLSTSWSSGGYLAHYFPNRFPDRFSCIATRLSNFSGKLLIESTVPLYKNRIPVAIFVGDSDLPATKSESEDAVAWYMARNFRVVRGKMIDSMGHSRIPQTAAAFFAEQMGIKPLHPIEAAKTIRQVQMTEYYPPQELIAKMSPPPQLGPVLARGGASPPSAAATVAQPKRLAAVPKQTVSYRNTNAGRDYPFEQRPEYQSMPEKQVAAAPQKSRPSVPRTAAGATRVASAQPQSSNWLEPVDRAGRDVSPKAVSLPSPPPARAKPKAKRTIPPPRKVAVKTPKRPSPPKAKPTSAGSQARRPAREVHKASPRVAAARSFTPTDAGSRDHDLWQRANPLSGTPSASPVARRSARTAFRGGAHGAVRSSSARPRRRGPAKRVNIRFKGPAIGTSPHYLAYSADLPPEQLAGADFLWKDNGMWMGDEASGVKILESPGLHRITVLLVTRDNKEYRGMATVQVLQAGPASTRTALAPH